MTEKQYSAEELSIIKKIETAVQSAFRDHLSRIKDLAGEESIKAIKSGNQKDAEDAKKSIEKLASIEQARFTAMNAIANATGVKLTY